MKKVLLSIILLLGIANADLIDSGLKKYNSGNKIAASKDWKKACDRGNMVGCSNLALMYYNGDGVRQDKRKAKELYGKACDGGVMGGCKNYRILNEQGF